MLRHKFDWLIVAGIKFKQASRLPGLTHFIQKPSGGGSSGYGGFARIYKKTERSQCDGDKKKD